MIWRHLHPWDCRIDHDAESNLLFVKILRQQELQALDHSIHVHHLLDGARAREIEQFSEDASNPIDFLLDRLQMPIGQVISQGSDFSECK